MSKHEPPTEEPAQSQLETEPRPDGKSERGPDRQAAPPLEPAVAAAVAALPRAQVWLLDGYNVLHTAFFRDQPRAQWWRGPHRQRLVECARRFAGEADEIWVVFDGPVPAPDDDATDRVRIHFAPSADAWITRRVRQSESPESMAVVTSDRQVQGRTGHGGAAVVSPAAFLSACGPSASRVVAKGRSDESAS